MKKILFLLCLAIISQSVCAQSFTKGYKGNAELGYSIGEWDYKFNRIEVNTIHGYLFSQYLYLGAGVGLHFAESYSTLIDHRESKTDIPIFANLRSHFLKGKFTPFVDLRGGTFVNNEGGTYLNFSLGCRMHLQDNMGISLSVGYAKENLKMDSRYSSKARETECISIRAGFDF